MHLASGRLFYALLATAVVIPVQSGCTTVQEYVRNGFKIGPNYSTPQAAVAPHWIDAADIRSRDCEDLSQWWTVFNDPMLNRLILCAYQQNLSLREAGYRILEARAQLAIAVGDVFPQQQNATGYYKRLAISRNQGDFPTTGQFFDQWNMGFNLAWELDFWGRFRRAVTAAEDQLDASVADYDDVLVTLLGDIATNYVQVRTLQERIRLLQHNVKLQRWVLDLFNQRLRAGRATKLDTSQAISNLEQTESQIPELEISLRAATNRLCVLMGMPPVDLLCMLGEDHIPTAPPDVVIGVPCDLLRRRPDVRRAERQAAAQSEQIGIALSDFYPAVSINGTLGYQAKNFPDLFRPGSLNGNIGPSFQWNILNYGRLLNNARFQEARFGELVTVYQEIVLRANEEAENGVVIFLRAHRREQHLSASVDAATEAVKTIFLQYSAGKAEADFNRYATIEQNRVQQQDQWAQSRGEIAQGLIQIYRALGGGWELRTVPCPQIPPPGPPPQLPPMPDEIPIPPTGPQTIPTPPPMSSWPEPGPNPPSG